MWSIWIWACVSGGCEATNVRVWFKCLRRDRIAQQGVCENSKCKGCTPCWTANANTFDGSIPLKHWRDWSCLAQWQPFWSSTLSHELLGKGLLRSPHLNTLGKKAHSYSLFHYLSLTFHCWLYSVYLCMWWLQILKSWIISVLICNCQPCGFCHSPFGLVNRTFLLRLIHYVALVKSLNLQSVVYKGKTKCSLHKTNIMKLLKVSWWLLIDNCFSFSL